MRIKHFFLIFVILLLSILALMAYLLVGMGSVFFYILEGIIILTFVFLIIFYRKIVKPMNTIGNGMDLLREQDFSSRLSPVGQREADRIVKIFNRMMEQLKNERLHLREQNHFLDLVIKASPMGVILVDKDNSITTLNPAAANMLGYPNMKDVEGKDLFKLDSSLAVELKEMNSHEVKTVRLSDSSIYKCTHSSFVDQGYQHPFFLIEGLTHEVMKAEKRAYEKVIRMIAHEVNNTTAGITSTLDTVEFALAEIEETEDIRDVMRVCIERCYSMSRFITNFANVVKIPEASLSFVNLNDVVFSCKRFMETVCLNRNINIHTDFCEEDIVVNLDSSLFEQVLVNIIKNAAESIGADGDIYIRTSLNPTCLEIADTGKGISKDTEAKLFTPFFSTKPTGQGIGLVFIREVLIKHGFTFSLKTYPDNLTRFRIYF